MLATQKIHPFHLDHVYLQYQPWPIASIIHRIKSSQPHLLRPFRPVHDLIQLRRSHAQAKSNRLVRPRPTRRPSNPRPTKSRQDKSRKRSLRWRWQHRRPNQHQRQSGQRQSGSPRQDPTPRHAKSGGLQLRQYAGRRRSTLTFECNRGRRRRLAKIGQRQRAGAATEGQQ